MATRTLVPRASETAGFPARRLEQDEIRLSRDDGTFSSLPRTQRSTHAASRPLCTLHGVVFAILCLGPAIYRRRDTLLRPGHELVGASRSRQIDFNFNLQLWPRHVRTNPNVDGQLVCALTGP